MANAAARRAIDPEHLTPAKQATELLKLTTRLKKLAAMVDELNARALTNALDTPTNSNTETDEHEHTDETSTVTSAAS